MQGALQLTPVNNAVELTERIRIFWEVFNLDSCWNAALNQARFLSDDRVRGTQIDAPWPMDTMDSVHNTFLLTFRL